MHRGRYDDARAFPRLAHENGLRHRRRPVVHGRIRHVHPRQLANHRLVLENRLQNSLADFRLIRRVRRAKRFLADHRLHNRRDVMPIRARAAKNALVDDIFLRHFGNARQHFHFRKPCGQIQFPLIHFARHRGVQIIQTLYADRRQHRLPFLRGRRHIARHLRPPRPLRRTLRNRRPKAAPTPSPRRLSP